jgi:tetratricopeptide (TPR) repeat protein
VNYRIMNEEHIENFLNGELQKEEILSIEERMARDSEFKNSVMMQKAIMKGFSNKRKKDFRHKLQELERSMGPVKQKSGNRIYMYRIGAVAAVLLLLLVAKLVIQTSPMNKYFEPYPNYAAPVQRGDDSFNKGREAFLFYEEGDFKSALEEFKNLPESDTIAFYKAQCLMATGDLGNASTLLERLIIDRESVFLEQSNWYLALLYLENGNSEQAKVSLEYLVDHSGFHSEEAKTLLKSL